MTWEELYDKYRETNAELILTKQRLEDVQAWWRNREKELLREIYELHIGQTQLRRTTSMQLIREE